MTIIRYINDCQGVGKRGTGAELRVMGIDPDSLQKRAEAAGAIILQPAADFPHGWRDVILEDPDGYIWAVGVPLKKKKKNKKKKKKKQNTTKKKIKYFISSF